MTIFSLFHKLSRYLIWLSENDPEQSVSLGVNISVLLSHDSIFCQCKLAHDRQGKNEGREKKGKTKEVGKISEKQSLLRKRIGLMRSEWLMELHQQ